MTRRLTPGGTPHLLLSMACAVPLTRHELVDRLDKRGHWPPVPGVKAALSRLTEVGCLKQTAHLIHRNTPRAYVLTPEGEAELNRLGAA